MKKAKLLYFSLVARKKSKEYYAHITVQQNPSMSSLSLYTADVQVRCCSLLKNFNIKIDKRLGKAQELNTHLQAQTYRDLIATK